MYSWGYWGCRNRLPTIEWATNHHWAINSKNKKQEQIPTSVGGKNQKTERENKGVGKVNGKTYEKVTKDLDYFLKQDMGCNQEEARNIKKIIVGCNVLEGFLC